VKEEKEKALTASTRAGSAENKEIKSLHEQLAVSKAQAQDLTVKLEKVCMYTQILYRNSFFLNVFNFSFQNATHVF
jgi:hypothetical protein